MTRMTLRLRLGLFCHRHGWHWLATRLMFKRKLTAAQIAYGQQLWEEIKDA